VIFGFGKKKKQQQEEEDNEEQELESILFQGATNGVEANLAANARLVEAGLVATKELVADGLSRRAEMIRIEPKGPAALIGLYIDGVAYPGGRLSKQQGFAVTQMLKLLAGLDIKERAKPQSGGIKAEYNDIKYLLLIETFPLGEGVERLVLRAQNTKVKLESPDSIGLPKTIRDRVSALATGKRGLILTCGAPRTGVTTTTRAVLRSIDGYLYQIYSIANVGGEDLLHITQVEREGDEPLETLMTRVRRMEADVIFVDPIRDATTAKSYIDMSKEMAVVAEFTAKDASQGIMQLVQWTGDAALVAENVDCVVSSMLIRLLCKDCKQAYRPNPKVLAKLGLPPETKILYRPGEPVVPEDDPEGEPVPCDKCAGLGYLGRTGLFEMLEMTPEMKKAVASGADAAALKALARKEKMHTLQGEGLKLVAEGRTSLEELQRVFKSGG